ncbi:MAG TPA: indole-3-glycerol phosphate synthase TrpC [Halanaerobiaceae bacterium]|jgi:indole-3-glycerol phosphate synthase|nr:indole-3-glycerol phosphate synthase TrpC [Bacillota bacterium]HHU92730.1 indole-3-glycerol phosphate synthase TrpC [Halanaerobiaceae bacterium]HOA39813.1 indole-3-glycerol phosphate synthase TrpC [Halanaerobiales bacterium]HPZ62601.1 indole-3-glycerol phosphate synthase TrpC [Halanaerobiales bacterium]HQD03870.1 indole-3-glycerol phosphate synthase TrpC [Halanaerobiales bacterium]
MILEKIVLEKEKEIENLKRAGRSLKKRLADKDISLIAEIKKASPTKGLISKDFQPEFQLAEYIRAGAAAVSILTDEKFFQGSKELFQNLRKETTLPLLRKDFIIEPIQVYESLFLGADVILLIASILEEEKLKDLLKLVHSLGLEAIVEVHSLEDLEKILGTPAEIIGINNRNLQDFSVDLKTTEKIVKELQGKKLRDNYYIIAESGIKDREDIDYLRDLGVNGVLIGETLMKAADPYRKIRELGLN